MVLGTVHRPNPSAGTKRPTFLLEMMIMTKMMMMRMEMQIIKMEILMMMEIQIMMMMEMMMFKQEVNWADTVWQVSISGS